MAGKADAWEADILKLLLNATPIADVADNDATSPLTNVYVSLHTADPGDAGNQLTSEATYVGYARVAVARTTGGWAISGTAPTKANPVANITFPAGTGGSGTVTHFGIGSLSSGAGRLFYSGTVTPNIVTGAGVTPQLTTASEVTED